MGCRCAGHGRGTRASLCGLRPGLPRAGANGPGHGRAQDDGVLGRGARPHAGERGPGRLRRSRTAVPQPQPSVRLRRRGRGPRPLIVAPRRFSLSTVRGLIASGLVAGALLAVTLIGWRLVLIYRGAVPAFPEEPEATAPM